MCQTSREIHPQGVVQAHLEVGENTSFLRELHMVSYKPDFAFGFCVGRNILFKRGIIFLT